MSRSTGFWSKGSRQYKKALREEEEERIAPLRQELKSETDPEAKKNLQNQIQAIQAEFKEKRKAADSGLFLKA